MDPLSIIAGSIAVLGASGKVVKGLTKLTNLRNVPDLLLAVVNEVSDLSLIVQEIRSIFGQDTIHGILPPAATSTLNQLLDRAQAVLLDLDQIVNYRLLLPPKSDGEITVNRSAWLSEESHVLRLQGRLRTIRLDIVAGLATLNLSSALRFEVRLQELSLIAQNVQQSQQLGETRITQTPQQPAIDQLIVQLRNLQELQYRTDGTLRSIRADLVTSRGHAASSGIHGSISRREVTATESSEHIPGSLMPGQANHHGPSNTISIKVKQFMGSSCTTRKCLCTCHTRRRKRSPQLLDQLIGTLFLGYSSTPLFRPECNKAACSQPSFSIVTVVYFFPQWFLYRALYINSWYTNRDGPEIGLRIIRTRPDNSVIFHYADVGDIDGIKGLFAKGEASPHDITATHGNTLLAIAISGMKHEVCQFLLNEGADPYFQTGPYRSAAELAWERILREVDDRTALAAFRRMFPDHDYIENKGFTALHSIVLGLDCRNLSEYLQTCSRAEIDQTDNKGQTALYWAAARADLGTVQDLLAVHANPNILNYVGYGPLHLAAYNATIEIMDCLLSSGVQVNSRAKPDQMTPMIYMFYRRPDSICLKRLIEAGAYIDAQEYQGATALKFACQSNLSSGLSILLENQADINKSSFDGETPLHVAIQTNSHDTLKILLSHHADPTTYTNQGRSILHEAAEYGNLKTLQILQSAGLQGLETTRKNSAGNTPEHIANRRTNEPPEWHTAFSDLLASVTEEVPETSRSAANENHRALPTSVARRVILALVAQLFEEIQQISRYAAQLPRPPNAVLRVLLVVCVAVAWRLLP